MASPGHAGGISSGLRKLAHDDVEQVARERLSQDWSYATNFERISLHYEDGILTLHGRLPSFYLKQVLQTRLRGIDGVERIDNRVDVLDTGYHGKI
jgi:hypothetical protein